MPIFFFLAAIADMRDRWANRKEMPSPHGELYLTAKKTKKGLTQSMPDMGVE
jgi:phosphopantothenoylcysteine synthetase/decarboxylase